MNNVFEEKKDSITKTMAIIGFVAAILFFAWLAVAVVKVIPSAFSSLASLADSVYNYPEAKEIVVSGDKTSIESGEVVNLNWTEENIKGTYSLSYDCVSEVSVDVRMAGNVYSPSCNEVLTLGKVNSAEVMITSNKERFSDVSFVITFIPESGADTVSGERKITVTNTDIPTVKPAEEVLGVTTDTTEKTPTKTNTTGGQQPTGYKTIEVPVYTYPVSDPNGYADLSIKLLGVGILNTDKQFVQASSISKDQTGALQFEVSNIGTKTSKTWSYEAELPSQINYESSTQDVLRPSEKVVVTIGFDGLTKTGREEFSIKLGTSGDASSKNNSIT